jgi:hypothetical protein
MGQALDILDEPAGEAYTKLIDLLGSSAAAFSLVWRDQFGFDLRADSFRLKLAPFLIEEDHASVWPGTQLLGHRAWVRRYRIEKTSLSILKTAPSLYAWIYPVRPEDLAFYEADGECLLGSIAHERDAWFGNDAIARAIAAQIPALKVALS